MTKRTAVNKEEQQMSKLEDVLNTLNYCLETFYHTCQCGECNPCTQGTRDIERAIETVSGMLGSEVKSR